jgi:uncharacterized protein YchJ
LRLTNASIAIVLIGLLCSCGGQNNTSPSEKGALNTPNPEPVSSISPTADAKKAVQAVDGSDTPSPNTGKQSPLFNNIQNLGYVVQDSSWLIESTSAVYKVKANGELKEKISDDQAQFLNLAGDYIYYSNLSDNNKIYRISVDGKKKEKLAEDNSEFLNVVNGWIYYTNTSDGFKIYKVKVDGTGRAPVANDTSSSLYLKVFGDWIYYSNSSTDGGKALYKINIDGTGKASLSNEPSDLISILDNWIFYRNTSDKMLYKMMLDGTKKTKLGSDPIYSYALSETDVYYSSRNKGIYQMSLDGANSIKLSEDTAFNINLSSQFIYYMDGEGETAYRMDRNGQNKKELSLSSSAEPAKESIEQAIELAKAYLKSKNEFQGFNQETSKVEYDRVDTQGRLVIHVFNTAQNQTDTIAWLSVDIASKTVEVSKK